MNVDDLLGTFRNICDDQTHPYFWSDDLFYDYLTDAIVQYCTYGRGIRDHTSSLTTLEYTADNPWVPLDEKIKKIVSAFDLSNNQKPLRIIDWETYVNESFSTRHSDYGVLMGSAVYPSATGTITTLLLGMEENKIRLVNIPIVSGTLKLVVERYPLKRINENYKEIEGVPINNRLDLLDWVKHKAYLHQDAETFDPDRAEASRLLFMQKMSKVDSEDMIRTKKKGHTRYGGL